MNRDEHLRWCKDRALEYVKVGDAKQAVTSFMSDMSKNIPRDCHKVIPQKKTARYVVDLLLIFPVV